MPKPPYVAFDPIGYKVPAAVAWLNFGLTTANLAAIATYRLLLLAVCPSYAAMLYFWLATLFSTAFVIGIYLLMTFPAAINIFAPPSRKYFGSAKEGMNPFPLGQTFSIKFMLAFGVCGHLFLLLSQCAVPLLEVRHPLLEYPRSNICAHMMELPGRHPVSSKPPVRLRPASKN